MYQSIRRNLRPRPANLLYTICEQVWFSIVRYLETTEMLDLSNLDWHFYHIVWNPQSWKKNFALSDSIGWKLLGSTATNDYDFLLKKVRKIDIPGNIPLKHFDQVQLLYEISCIDREIPSCFLTKHSNSLQRVELFCQDIPPSILLTQTFPLLRYLYIISSLITHQDIECVSIHCPRLNTLVLRGVCLFNQETTLNCLLSLPLLEEFTLGGSPDFLSPEYYLHPLFKKLTSLGLSSKGLQVQTSHIYQILDTSWFPQLSYLSLYGFSLIESCLQCLPVDGFRGCLTYLHLYDLDEWDWKDYKSQEESYLTEIGLLCILKWAPQLTKLELSRIYPKDWGVKTCRLLQLQDKPIRIDINEIPDMNMDLVEDTIIPLSKLFHPGEFEWKKYYTPRQKYQTDYMLRYNRNLW